jgi:hypothetical protein
VPGYQGGPAWRPGGEGHCSMVGQEWVCAGQATKLPQVEGW